MKVMQLVVMMLALVAGMCVLDPCGDARDDDNGGDSDNDSEDDKDNW